MKILMLVPFLPNTETSGGQTRWYNLIKYLSKDHDITLFSLIKDNSEKNYIPELEKYCRKVRVFKRSKTPWTWRNLFLTAIGYYPFLVIRNYSPQEKSAIAEELKNNNYDLIHAETFYVMPHIPKTDVPSILVEQTIEYMVYKHYVDHVAPKILWPIFMVDVIKLKFWEKYFWKKTNRLVSVSSEDKKVMQKLVKNISVDIIPNGVDSEYYANKSVAKKSPPRVMYGVTNFEWLQNVEAVDILINEVWPIIHAKNSSAILWIVGRKIPQRIKDLALQHKDIEITESIKDARDAYLGSTVMVTPIKGSGGTRLKILEAMAAGLPIVSTSTGVAGLDVTHSENVLITDTSEGLAAKALNLLEDKALAKKIGNAGKKFVADNFDWQQIVRLHDPIYKEALSKK